MKASLPSCEENTFIIIFQVMLDLIESKDLRTDCRCVQFMKIYEAFDTVKHTLLFDFYWVITLKKGVFKLCISSASLAWGSTRRSSTSPRMEQGYPAAPCLFPSNHAVTFCT